MEWGQIVFVFCMNICSVGNEKLDNGKTNQTEREENYFPCFGNFGTTGPAEFEPSDFGTIGSSVFPP